VSLPLLDRRSAVPLYYQIRQHLLDEIRSGVLTPGQPIPSEQELSAKLSVSRMTARQAVKSLCDEGLVYAERGKGTFVSGIKQEKNVSQLLSFTEEMKMHGARVQSRVLSFKAVPSDTEVAAIFRLRPGAKVLRLKRVRLANSETMGVETSYLPFDRFANLLKAFDGQASLYQTLAERYGVQMASADEVAEAGLASAQDARLLGIRAGSPVFLFTRISYLKNGRPTEFVRSVYRGDRFKIVNRLRHQMQPNSGWRRKYKQ
jgi:GntR family transcriptional regulator